MTRSDADELRETRLEATRILGPQLIMQEDPHGVESVKSGPAQFGIDAPWVVGAGLKHLQLIDGGGGDEVGANGPALRLIPGVGTIA